MKTHATPERAPSSEPVPHRGPRAVQPSRLVDHAPDASQLRKNDLLGLLRPEIVAAISEELAGTDWTVDQCPWIEYWFNYYQARDAASVEAALRKYARLDDAVQGTDYITPVVARIRAAIRRWRATGEIDAPTDSAPMRSFDAEATSLAAQLGRGERAPVTSAMASVLGNSASEAQIHTDAHAARLADRADALAFTIGQHVVLGASAPRPGTLAGDALLAHELAHVQQQPRDGAAVAQASSSPSLEANANAAVASVASAQIGFSAGRAWSAVRAPLGLQRCAKKESAEDKAKRENAQALASNQAELADIVANEPAAVSAGSLPSVGAFETRRAVLEQWIVARTGGRGPLTGIKSGEPGDTTDCTDFVAMVMNRAYSKLGKTKDWERIKKLAIALNKPNAKGKKDAGLNGLELQQTLMAELGWKSVFWARDPTYRDYHRRVVVNNQYVQLPDGSYQMMDDTEAYDRYVPVRDKRKYYGIRVDQLAINYHPETKAGAPWTLSDSKTVQDLTGIQAIEKIPFGILTARGGDHMSLVIDGWVYEAHWDKKAGDVDLYERKPLRDWGWDSGLIVAPGDDVDKAFGKP